MGDWYSFLGSPRHPALVATVTEREENFSSHDLMDVWPDSSVVPVATGGLGLNALDPAAIFEVIESASSEWVLLIKLDTLPYCRAPEAGFLEGLVEQINGAGLWGATGSFIPCGLLRDGEGRPVTSRYSNNYSLFRRDAWLDVISSRRPDFVEQVRTRKLEPESRFVPEATIESYLSESGDRMLFLEDTPERSVFHVNQWGQDLLEVRRRYLLREGVFPYLNRYNAEQQEPWMYPAWQRYYGWPKPTAMRRLRAWAGRARRQLLPNRLYDR